MAGYTTHTPGHTAPSTDTFPWKENQTKASPRARAHWQGFTSWPLKGWSSLCRCFGERQALWSPHVVQGLLLLLQSPQVPPGHTSPCLWSLLFSSSGQLCPPVQLSQLWGVLCVFLLPWALSPALHRTHQSHTPAWLLRTYTAFLHFLFSSPSWPLTKGSSHFFFSFSFYIFASAGFPAWSSLPSLLHSGIQTSFFSSAQPRPHLILRASRPHRCVDHLDPTPHFLDEETEAPRG